MYQQEVDVQTVPSAPQQSFYHAPKVVFDGKRMRKAVVRKTVDYNSSIIRMLEVLPT